MPTVWRANIGYQTNFEFGPSPFGRGWQLNLDYIFSHYKNPFTIVDLSPVPDIRKGLNGFYVGRTADLRYDRSAARRLRREARSGIDADPGLLERDCGLLQHSARDDE